MFTIRRISLDDSTQACGAFTVIVDGKRLRPAAQSQYEHIARQKAHIP
jgi:aerobic-type carbon monoxide dehydrogenase small subunit (CoxS/CutS family)